MNIIEQIDARFTFMHGYEFKDVTLTHAEWQQIKEAFAKVREDALEGCLQICESKKAHAETTYGVSESVGADMCIRAIRALKDGE